MTSNDDDPSAASRSTARIVESEGDATPGSEPAAIRTVKRQQIWPWAMVVAVGILSLTLIRGFATSPSLDWAVFRDYLFDKSVLTGVGRSLLYTVLAMTVAVSAGLCLAVMSQSEVRALRWLCLVYIWFFRGLPTLVLLLLFYNLALAFPRMSLGIPFTGIEFLSADTNDVITPFAAGVIGLALAEAAYMCEIIRGGLLSVDRGQKDAAASLGMTGGYTLRRVVLPQALRIIIPPTGNETIAMLKGTALISVISGQELLTRTTFISNDNFRVIEMLFVACFWYLVLTTVLSIGQRQLEKRVGRGHQVRQPSKVQWRRRASS